MKRQMAMVLGAAIALTLTIQTVRADDQDALIPAGPSASSAPVAPATVTPPALRPVTPPVRVVTEPVRHAPPLTPVSPPATPTPPATPPITPANPPRVSVAQQLRTNIAWQVALEGSDFSPGIIDGHFKRKSLMALSEFAARFYPGVKPLDPQVYAGLKVDVDNAITTYTITADDAAQVGMLPENWNEKSKLDRLPYDSLADCISEKFHTTRGLLLELNPGLKLEDLAPDQTINVPNIRPFPTDNKIAVQKRSANTGYVVVNLGEKTIRVFDKSDAELALFHCSIAKDKEKLPTRDAKVQVIAAPLPNYTFRPEMWPDVHDVTQVLNIPPGPRNPVGLAWVGLDLPGYGIHGSPKPELIGKTGSHGCFRLTNWDALKFAGFVKEGMTVKIVTSGTPVAQ